MSVMSRTKQEKLRCTLIFEMGVSSSLKKKT